MKNRNLWRVLSLALVLVMLFAIVACTNTGDPESTTGGKQTTAAKQTTAKQTTTAKKTQASKTTVVTTTGATTTAAPTEKYSATYTVKNAVEGQPGGAYTFHNHIPAAFAGEGAIIAYAKDHDANDVGVGTSCRICGTSKCDCEFKHFYINDSNADIPHSEKFMTVKFTVAEAGTYDLLLGVSQKDGDNQRGAYVQVDDGTKVALSFIVPKTDFDPDNGVFKVVDSNYGAWVTVEGLSFELAAGEHTLKITYNASVVKSIHFRHFIFAKQGAAPAEPIVVPTATVANFSKTMPEAFTAATTIKIDGMSCVTDLVNVSDNNMFLLKDPTNVPSGASAHGGRELAANEATVDPKPTHIYLDPGNVKDANGNKTPVEDAYFTWEFTTTEAGNYTLGFEFRLKVSSGQKRYGMFIIDGQTYKVGYELEDDQREGVTDVPTSTSYMTLSDLVVALEAGNHTITYKLDTEAANTSSWHFRDIYVIKAAAPAA